MESLNPVEWLAWIYGKLFFRHTWGIWGGGAIVVSLFAVLGLVFWVRAVDKYNDEHASPKMEAARVNSPSTGASAAAKEETRANKLKAIPKNPAPTGNNNVTGSIAQSGDGSIAQIGNNNQVILPPSPPGINAKNALGDKIQHNVVIGKMQANLENSRGTDFSENLLVQPPDWPSATDLTFDSTKIGDSRGKTLTLQYHGSLPTAKIESLELYGEDAGDFGIGDSTCAVGTELQHEGTCEVIIIFAPKSAGQKRAIFSSNYVGGEPSPITLYGTGGTLDPAQHPPQARLYPGITAANAIAAHVENNRISAPVRVDLSESINTWYENNEIIGISDSSPSIRGANFGQLKIGSSSSQVLSFTNPKSNKIVIEFVQLEGENAEDFKLTSIDCWSGYTINPQGHCLFYVSFAPYTSGRKNALLTMQFIGGDSTKLPISGVAVQ